MVPLTRLNPIHQRSTEVKKISEWLSNNNWYSYHQAMVSRRADNTGIWFLECDEFQTWIDDKNGRLWATGMRKCLSLRFRPNHADFGY